MHSTGRDHTIRVIVWQPGTERSQHTRSIVARATGGVEITEDYQQVVWWYGLGGCRQLIVEVILVMILGEVRGSICYNYREMTLLVCKSGQQ